MHRDRLTFRGASVLDGTGSPGVVRDVGIVDGRITLQPAAGGLEIDARRKFLAPGFIDIHSHDDLAVMEQPVLACKSLQGVTTVVFSNCGTSPINWPDPLFGSAILAQDFLKKLRPSVNVAWLLPHGWLRRMVMGFTDRPAHPREVEVMSQMIRDEGAWGMSTRTAHPLIVEAKPDEIAELARAAGFVAMHPRTVEEAIETSRHARVHWSGLRASGLEKGRAEEIVGRLSR